MSPNLFDYYAQRFNLSQEVVARAQKRFDNATSISFGDNEVGTLTAVAHIYAALTGNSVAPSNLERELDEF